jgi:hypothetical protein
MQIQQFAIALQRLKSMGAPFRNYQRSAVQWSEFFGVPLQESIRILTKIDGHIPHTPSQTGHQLHFCVRRSLTMQSTDGPRRLRSGLIDLCDMP